jgi:SAM-dependent methyltransferase
LKPQLLELLGCPGCSGDLRLVDAREAGAEIESGQLVCPGCDREYPIVRFVPRFVPQKNYAESFGLQWTCFRTTQLDSHTGQPITRERFLRQTGWRPGQLAGMRVLDVGCGAGRFAEVALSCGARVVGVDFSIAVEACRENLGHHAGLDVVQADVCHLPFRAGRFDFVYCFGVLQHTSDVERAFMALPAQLRAGGRLAVDVYPKQLTNALWPKYWLRWITKRMPPGMLFGLVRGFVPVFWPISLALGRVPLIGRKLRHVLPIANYDGVYPLTPTQLREWAVLDTFDMLAPTHDHPQTARRLRAWLDTAGLRDVEILRPGVLVARGVK